MKIAVTGGCGFIGGHVCDCLLYRGFSVRTIGRCTHGNSKYADHVRADIRDFKSIKKATKGCDAIMHYAALINVDESIRAARAFFNTNVFGTFNILEVARERKIPVVYKSTCEVFGNVPYPDKADENYRLMPRSPYAASKLCAERYCLAYQATYDLPITISRGFNTYGPRQNAGPYGAVIPKFIVNACNNAPPRIFGDGHQTRDYIYVKDVAKADVLILEMLVDGKISSGEMFNICTGIEHSIRDIAYRIIDLCGMGDKIKPVYVKARSGEVRRNIGNFEKARITLGWKPEYSFDDGLMETIEWFRTLHEYHNPKKFRSPRDKRGISNRTCQGR